MCFVNETGDSLTYYSNYARYHDAGSPVPKVYGGMSTRISFGGLELSGVFSYAIGGKAYNTGYSVLMYQGKYGQAFHRDILKRWQKPGDVAKYKRLTNSVNGSETRPTSRFVMDENTLTFGSLSLTYRMDQQNTRFLKKSFISSLKWGFTMEDIFYLSSVKQERGLDYPFARQFAISLNVVFK